ncbi:MAG: hypothetical protein KF705_10405 [Phycisphaeraceae bacterium]|nr:hypothetical protein [Phycisphaeraceae bacterium]
MSSSTPGAGPANFWFGSDTPIVRPDAEDSIRAAVHRRRADMPAAEAIAPEQAVAEPEAWGAFVVP